MIVLLWLEVGVVAPKLHKVVWLVGELVVLMTGVADENHGYHCQDDGAAHHTTDNGAQVPCRPCQSFTTSAVGTSAT